MNSRVGSTIIDKTEINADIRYIKSYLQRMKEIQRNRSKESAFSRKCEAFTMTILTKYYMLNNPPDGPGDIHAAAYTVKRCPAFRLDTAVRWLTQFTPEELHEARKKRYISKRVMRYADELILGEFLPVYNELKNYNK